jgi:hypothetical protein
VSGQKGTAKGIRIVIAIAPSHFAGPVAAPQILARLIKPPMAQIGHRRLPDNGAKPLHEPGPRHAGVIGQLFNGQGCGRVFMDRHNRAGQPQIGQPPQKPDPRRMARNSGAQHMDNQSFHIATKQRGAATSSRSKLVSASIPS